MVTMTFLLNDRDHIKDYMQEALNRRKQLCPFPLELDELIEVQHSPRVARTVRFILNVAPKTLNWGNSAILIVDDPDHPAGQLVVKLKTKTTFPVSTEMRGPRELYLEHNAEVVRCWNSPETAKLRDWAWAATQIELENRWAMGIIRKLAAKASTHQQIHRYMPEIYSLLVQHEATLTGANKHSRFKSVQDELAELGSTRAQKVELAGVTLKDRSNLKSLVVHALLMDSHDGLGVNSEFDQTWVEPTP